MDEAGLLERWRAGDRAAGDALFEAHFDAVYGFFARKVPGDVSDLVQATFTGLVEARDRAGVEVSLRAYLFGIARNVLYGHYRLRRRGQAVDLGVTSLADLEPTPSALVAKQRDRRLLLSALRHIPLDLQIAIELHYWEGLRGPEIAAVLGIPEGTVRSRLRRALEQLRAEVARLGRGDPSLTTTLTDLEDWAKQLAEAR